MGLFNPLSRRSLITTRRRRFPEAWFRYRELDFGPGDLVSNAKVDLEVKAPNINEERVGEILLRTTTRNF